MIHSASRGAAFYSRGISFFEEIEDGFIDFLRRLPHGDVAALLDEPKLRTRDGSMEAFSQSGGKNEVPFSPEE